jgi:hypothetical protein
MSAFDEKTEQAIKKAMERPEIKSALSDKIVDLIPVISIIISAALEELKKENCDADNSESNTGTDPV